MIEPLTAESPYKLYRYIQPGHAVLDFYEVPWGINYLAGISARLHPKRSFTLGELTEVIYYASFDGQNYSDPIVRETYVYVRDPASAFAISRTQTIEWYVEDDNADDVIGPHPKQRGPKFYISIAEKRDEVQRKRRNQTSKASEAVIGALIYGVGMSQADAVAAGQAYWKTLTDEVLQYEEGNTEPLRSRMDTDVSPAWVPAIKTFALAELV